MAVTTPPPPAPPHGVGGPVGPTGPGGWGGLRAPALAVASATSQFAVFTSCVLAMALAATATGHGPYTVLAATALAVGILLGLGTPIGRAVETVSGLVGALIAVAVTTVLFGVLASQGTTLPPVTILLAGLLVLGMDWRLVGHLRLLPFASGFLVVAAVGMERGWAYPAAVAWFAVAIGALWLLENDRRNALDRPDPDAATPVGPAPPPPLDVVRTIGIALAIGLAAAFVLGTPSCSPFSPRTPKAPDLGQRGLDGLDPSTGHRALPGEVPPERRLDGGDQERTYDVDARGRRSFTDPATGERFTVEDEGGRQVVRGQDGREVATLDDRGVVAGDGDRDGAGQRYRTDSKGRVYTEGKDGERLYLDRSGGRTVLRKGDGTIVAEGGSADDHLEIRDPNGDTVVPDPNGDGQIPAPGGALVDGALGGDQAGRTYRYDGDKTIVTDADGDRRTYDRDAAGNERVKVERKGFPDRTYVYDDGKVPREVLEYDEHGKLLHRYRYDPDGVLVDGTGAIGGGTGSSGTDTGSSGTDSSGSGSSGSGSTDQPDPKADPPKGDHGSPPWGWIVGGVLAVAAATGLGVWLYRRRTPPEGERPWAEAQARRIESFGAAHGRARRHDESVLEHTRVLAASVAPDDRLPEVGRALSDALFGPTDIGPERRAWVEATLAEVFEAHPPPSWTDRFHRKDRDEVPVP